MITEFLFIGLITGLLGLFYRDCLKGKDMIFQPIYLVLKNWVDTAEFCRDWYKDALDEGYNIQWRRFLGWIAYPLGYCIYCSTTWISIFTYIMYLSSWVVLPNWQWIVLGLITVMGVSHLTVLCACRWMLKGHPDMDTSYGQEN